MEFSSEEKRALGNASLGKLSAQSLTLLGNSKEKNYAEVGHSLADGV